MTPPSLTIRRAARALSALAALTTAAPSTAQGQLSLSPRPTLTIGSFDGDEMYQFHQISNVRALSDGRTLVTMGPDLRFYDRNGRFVNKAGGRGRGPGEFQYIQGLRVLPGDTLLALSFRDLVTLAPDGKYVRQRALDLGPLAANGFMSEGASLLDNGNLLAPQYKASSPTDPPRLQLSRPFLRYVLFNASTGTVTPLLESGGLRQMMVGANNPAVQPFSPHAQAAVGRDRVAVGDNDSTFVLVFDLFGRQLTRITVADRPTPVTAAHLAASRKQSLEWAGTDRARLERFEAGWAAVPKPTRHPYWGRMMLDALGNLWVSSPAIPDVRATWTVFDRDGRRVGALLFPERFSPMDIGADFVLGVARDEDGVEYVHRYVLQRPGR
jgi:hypothetical protein